MFKKRGLDKQLTPAMNATGENCYAAEVDFELVD
jgi:hypothetical protein